MVVRLTDGDLEAALDLFDEDFLDDVWLLLRLDRSRVVFIT